MRPRPEATDRIIDVRACKFDGSEHRRWRARLIRGEGSLIVLEGNFAEEVRHSLLGTIAAETRSVEYYWFDRWYNVFRFTEPSGDLRNYYCNINLPPVLEGNVLSFIDLDMDVVVAPDFTCRVVDQDEFHDNASRFGYPSEIQERAMAAVDELLALIQTRQFPFSHTERPEGD